LAGHPRIIRRPHRRLSRPQHLVLTRIPSMLAFIWCLDVALRPRV
jgi:hypothetical protein